MISFSSVKRKNGQRYCEIWRGEECLGSIGQPPSQWKCKYKWIVSGYFCNDLRQAKTFERNWYLGGEHERIREMGRQILRKCGE